MLAGSNIVVDSDTDDWDDITSRTADALLVLSCGKQRFHQIIQSFILCMKELFRPNGTTAIWEANPVSITYADGTTGISDKIQFTGWKDSAQAKIHGMGI